MKGTQEEFHLCLNELSKRLAEYQNGKRKHYQYMIDVETIFQSYTWTKSDFYAELNRIRGIQMHPVKKKSKTKAKPRAKKVA